MIVEDDDEIRNYILTELSAEYRVICCGDGQEALEMALKERPELIVSDVMMPGMDGFELCRRVRKNINLNSTPVILLTAKSDTSDNAQGLDSGSTAGFVHILGLHLSAVVGALLSLHYSSIAALLRRRPSVQIRPFCPRRPSN